MKKCLVLVLAVMLVALSAGGAFAAPMKLRIGHVLDQKSTRHAACVKFAEVIAEKTASQDAF